MKEEVSGVVAAVGAIVIDVAEMASSRWNSVIFPPMTRSSLHIDAEPPNIVVDDAVPDVVIKAAPSALMPTPPAVEEEEGIVGGAEAIGGVGS